VNPWGKTHDLEDLTNRSSTLDDLLGEAAARQGRVMKPNTEAERGGFYRVDSFEFAKAGVPVLHAARGIEIIGKPPEYGKQKRDEFVAKHYHQPSDEVDPTWDLSGAVQDIQLLSKSATKSPMAINFLNGNREASSAPNAMQC